MPTAAVSAARRGLHRWIETRSRAGASSLNRSISGRPSALSFSDSSVGIASPTALANPSAISSGVKTDVARAYTRSASVRSARQSIMFARSTAWRHGDGRTSSAETSTSCRWPPDDQEVRRLQVAVGEPRVPEMPNEVEAPVDHGVVHVRVAEVPASLEELRDEHVLAVRGQLDDAVGSRDANACVAERAKRIVLVGHEAPHRAHRRLVLQLAVQDLPDHAIPAVGACMAGRIHLGEDPGAVLQGHPQRRGSARALQAERFDDRNGQAELVSHRPDDRLPALASEVEMRSVPAHAERHREDVLRHERSEGRAREDERRTPTSRPSG